MANLFYAKRCNAKKYKTHLIPCGCLYFTVEKNNSLNTDATFNVLVVIINLKLNHLTKKVFVRHPLFSF